MRNAKCEAGEMNDLAERIRIARTDAGYSTASDAARAFGWPVSTYLGHENGDRRPNLRTIERYAKAFRVDPAFIAYGAEENGVNTASTRNLIPISGYVKNLGYVDFSEFGATIDDFLEFNAKLPEGTYALLMLTDDLAPRYNIGDLLLVKSGITNFNHVIGDFCISKTSDGRSYLARLQMGNASKKFNLEIENHPYTIKSNVDVDEFGLILIIIPNRRIIEDYSEGPAIRVFSATDVIERNRP